MSALELVGVAGLVALGLLVLAGAVAGIRGRRRAPAPAMMAPPPSADGPLTPAVPRGAVPRGEASAEAYGDVRITLPGGRTVACQPMTVREGVYYLGLLYAAENGDHVAIGRFFSEFAAWLGIEDEPLAPAEVFDLGRSFLHLPTWTGPTVEEAETERATAETATSASG